MDRLMTKTQVDLTAAEIAAQQGVQTQTFNTWKRIASSKTGKAYGYKISKSWHYAPADVLEILDLGRSGETEPPKQVYESEDVEASQDGSFMVLAQSSAAIVQDLQTVLTMAKQQDDLLINTTVEYLAPDNRRARIMGGIAKGLACKPSETFTESLKFAFWQAPQLPPLTPNLSASYCDNLPPAAPRQESLKSAS